MCSIIVAGPLNNRVRDGNVCCKTAVNTGKRRKEDRKTDVGNELDVIELKLCLFSGHRFLAEPGIEKKVVKPHGILVTVS